MTMKRLSGSMLALSLLTAGLLAADDKALAEPAADSVQVCWDGFEAAEWGKLSQCLQDALKKEEATLAGLQKKARQHAEQSPNKAAALQALQESSDLWAKYKTSECDRQMAFVAGRNHPDVGELTCAIRQTAARIADLNFDEE